jgi:radical S-adenosyl methionine domain-containing protein 2
MDALRYITIDLSSFIIKVINPLHFHPDIENDLKPTPYEINNKFGWDVAYAEVEVSALNESIQEYRLFSKDRHEQCHAKKCITKELEYWRFEFESRVLDYSPDPFVTSLPEFLTFYYEDYLGDNSLLDKELDIPVVFYEIDSRLNLKCIRYSLSVNKLYTKDLFIISFTEQGYIRSIYDNQSYSLKHIVNPTPEYPNDYILQKFGVDQEHGLYQHEKVSVNEENSIVFHGFREYEVKYLSDSILEPSFSEYGFFIPELKKIINETELLLKYIPTVNYHLIKPCNMVCNHCFSDFSEVILNQLDYESAEKIIVEITKIKSFRKINFSGGEPTLFKGIEKLIKVAKEGGLETSMVTNGYKLINSDALFNDLVGYLDLLVLSVDSFDPVLNLKIGRHVRRNTISLNELVLLTEKCAKHRMKVKINTVVTKHNFNQVMMGDIALLKPIRWKIFRMLPVANQNDKAHNIHPTDEEFKVFIDQNKYQAEKLGVKVVSENNDEMTGSYIMISPDGRFFNNMEGKHNYSDKILKVGFINALQQTPLLREVFYKREGDYSCN